MKQWDSGHMRWPSGTCKKCLRFGRSAAIVGKGGRAKAGKFTLPRNWPVRQAGYYKLQYCPGVVHRDEEAKRAVIMQSHADWHACNIIK